jgi:hypothetical protein
VFDSVEFNSTVWVGLPPPGQLHGKHHKTVNRQQQLGHIGGKPGYAAIRDESTGQPTRGATTSEHACQCIDIRARLVLSFGTRVSLVRIWPALMAALPGNGELICAALTVGIGFGSGWV